jgi:hypothetical protein
MPQIKEFSSKDAQKSALIKNSDLIHYRIQGKLEFEKLGNAYFIQRKA